MHLHSSLPVIGVTFVAPRQLRETEVTRSAGGIEVCKEREGRFHLNMQTYAALNDFADAIEALPADLVRNFTLLREVDSKTVLLQSELIQEIRRFMDSLPFRPEERQQAQGRLLRIKELIMQGFAYSDEKVSVASTAADVVSKHMLRLDRDFSMLEEEMPLYVRQGSPPPQITTTAAAIRNAPKRVEASTPKKAAAQRAAAGANLREETATPQPVVSRHGRQSKPRRRSLSPVPPPARVTAAVQSEEEPTYCYCNQVSYGEMVACDGDDCEREWFHLACVNLSAPPKGSWFCDACKKAPTAPKRRRGP